MSEYSAELLPEIARYSPVDVYVDDYVPAGPEQTSHLRILPYREFESLYEQGHYENVVYHIANNPDHSYIYRQAVRVPGVVLLHDFNLHYLVADTTFTCNDWSGYFAELRYNAGEEPIAQAERVWRREIEPEYEKYPLNRRILENSRGLIVNNGFLMRLVEQTAGHAPAIVLPHGVSQPPAHIPRARASLGLDRATVVGAFGFMKPYKRIYSILHALHAIRELRPEVHLLLAGEEHPHYPLDLLIKELDLSQRVHRVGFVSTHDLWGYIGACDICCNLRFPTVGESSGPLMKIMALGKPVVVSDIGSYSELPDECCVKIPAGDAEVEFLARTLTGLIRSAESRRRIGILPAETAAAQVATILVRDLAGTIQGSQAFRVVHPQARIRAMVPALAVAGEGELLLKILGGPFVSSAVARWNGRPCLTRYQSVGELQVLVPRDELKEARRVYIEVVDPLQQCSGSPYAVRSAVHAPAEPLAALALPSGFYIFEVRAAPGTLDGLLELSTTPSPGVQTGAVHFGVGIPPSYLPQVSCTFSVVDRGRTLVSLTALSGERPVRNLKARVCRGCNKTTIKESASSGSRLEFAIELEAGLYVLEVEADGAAGAFLMGSVESSTVTSVVHISGWIEETMVGFVAFHTPEPTRVAVTTRCRSLGAFGADCLLLEVKDSSRNRVSADLMP